MQATKYSEAYLYSLIVDYDIYLPFENYFIVLPFKEMSELAGPADDHRTYL